ncbi:MAG: hypothetical protein JO064_12355 [Actinobacteria bacterium]|nr:hypothetical protein [Actinomycetota bacterium]
MRIFRLLPTRRLLLLLGVSVVVLGTVAAIAVGAIRDAGSPPAPQPLANAIHDAVTATKPDGITARVHFTNNLLPTGALTGNVGSALLSGADGRLWITNDGRGRIELQSDAGDVQIVWSPTELSVYDASSNTDYTLALPHDSSGTTQPAAPTVPTIDDFLTKLAQHVGLSDAVPGVVAGQGAYTVTASPKDPGGLLDSAQVAWDAQNGTPLELALYAKGYSAPALALQVTDISFGAVSSSDVDVAPPAGAHVVDLAAQGGSSSSTQPDVTGLDAVQAHVPFTIAAPDTLNGLARADVRLAGSPDAPAAVVTYGEGLGAVAVVERAADGGASSNGMLAALPTVTVGGVAAHELATELGTVLEWKNGGVSFVLAGSVSSADAEAAAAALA